MQIVYAQSPQVCAKMLVLIVHFCDALSTQNTQITSIREGSRLHKRLGLDFLKVINKIISSHLLTSVILLMSQILSKPN